MQETDSLSETLLKERAQQYIVDSQAEQGRLLGHLLIFRLANQFFGLTTDKVRRITKLEDGVILPRSKPLLLGLVNQRSIFVPLIDLCQILHLSPWSLKDNPTARLILMEGRGGDYGFLVEELYTVETIYEDCLISQGEVTQEKAAQIVEALLEVTIQQKKQKVVWLKEDVLSETVEKGL